MSENISRVDLHVHTHHSRTAGNWILDQIQINECYTKPIDVYNMARSRGMDFVTITDHDVISGALEVAHLPHFIISEEISAIFPHDKAKVHVIALNINERQHQEIQQLRFNIYELATYLNQQNIVHILAHPYFKMGPSLTMSHIEQMLLLFNIFEVKNGGKQLTPDNLFEQILLHLTPEKIWQIADKHNMAPTGETPWKKSMVGGSDDHGGILIASPHTVTEKAESVEELLAHIQAGRCRAEGQGGSPLALAHGALAVGYKYLKTKKKSFDLLNNKLAWLLLDNLFEETSHHGLFSLAFAYAGAQTKKFFSLKKKTVFGKNVHKQIFRRLKKNEKLQDFLLGKVHFNHNTNHTFFQMANTIVNEYIVAVFKDSMQQKSVLNKLKNVALLKNILSLIVPYIVGFKTEHADRALMRASAEQFLPKELLWPRKIAIFSDSTPADLLKRDEINYLMDDELSMGYKPIYFSTGEKDSHASDFYTYKSLVTLKESPRYGFPPFLKISYDFFEENCDIIFVDTLGPMGILGMLLGKLLKIPIVSTFHTLEVKALAEQSGGENSRFFKSIMAMFYAQTSHVRLLDAPSAMENDILAKSNTKVSILSDILEFETSDILMMPFSDIY